MLLVVAIWANEFQIIKIVVVSIFVLVVYLQYFVLVITTSFTTFASRTQQS